MSPISESSQILMETDATGEVVEMNDAARRLLADLGVAESEAARILPPDFADLVARACAQADPPFVRTATIDSRRFVWVFLPDAEGGRVRLFGIDPATWSDDSEGPSSVRQQLLTILSSIGDGIDIINGEHVIEFLNDVLKQRFGDCRGEKCYRVYYGRNEPCESCSVEQALASGAVQHVEKVAADGRTYDVTSSPFRDLDGQVKVIEVGRDVTERKEAETALRENEERFRALAEQSPVGICVVQNGRFAYVNPRCTELIGYAESEILAMDPAGFIHPDDQELVRERMARRLAGDGDLPARYEVRALTKDGQTRWLYIVAVSFEYRGRRATMAQVVDITARRHAEAALRESEERFRVLVERSPVALTVIQEDRIVFANPCCAEMLGYSCDALVGMDPGDLLHPEDRPLVLERMRRRLAGEDFEPSRYEIRAVTRDGETIWADMSAVACEYQGRRATMAHCIDITDRKQAEQALRDAETCYRELYEHATDIIYTHDLDWNVTSANAAAERVLGWPRTKEMGRTIREKIHPDSLPVVRRAFEEKLRHPERRTGPYEMQIYDAKGELRWLEVTSRLIFEHGKAVGTTGIARDITERKRLERQLRQAQKMEALGQLAGGVAHDFNNLLTGILGYAGLLSDRVSADPKARDSLAQIERAAERATALTRQLLAFSRRQQMSAVHLDLNRVIVDFLKLLSRTVGEHIEVRTDLGPDLPALYADPGQIEQVLLNLALNARDAMPEGGRLSIRTRLQHLDARFVATHSWARRGRFVRLTVADTGTGMSETTREHAFEPFFSTKTPDKGTGLGLAIVYGIVRQHDGLIHLDSKREKGSRFDLYFPAAERQADSAKPEAEAPPTAGGHERILLAEDEPIVRELASDILVEAGYSVTSVGDGEEALERFRAEPAGFDLLILDLVMPRKGGAEVRDEVHSLSPDTRILLTSGYAPESVETRVSHPQGPAFLAKPFTPQSLLRKVREVLEGE